MESNLIAAHAQSRPTNYTWTLKTDQWKLAQSLYWKGALRPVEWLELGETNIICHVPAQNIAVGMRLIELLKATRAELRYCGWWMCNLRPTKAEDDGSFANKCSAMKNNTRSMREWEMLGRGINPHTGLEIHIGGLTYERLLWDFTVTRVLGSGTSKFEHRIMFTEFPAIL